MAVAAFATGLTPIPEMIGGFTGRIAASATSAQIKAQASLQGATADAQQDARVAADKELQLWQAGLQADLAALNAALEGTKLILVQKTNADLQARNSILQINAQLQADRVRQIIQIQEMLERGNITSAQVIDMVRNLKEAFQLDASRQRQQADAVKSEVMDRVTRVTPLQPEEESAVLATLEDGVLDPDVVGALADLERRVADIQVRFALRQQAPLRTATSAQ